MSKENNILKRKIDSLREIIKKNPNDVEARIELGVFMLALRQFNAAEAEFREVLKINPNCAEAHGLLGDTLVGVGYPRRQIEAEFREAIRLAPNSAVVRY